MTNHNAVSGENDFTRADAVDELVKGWETEDDVLSSPDDDENHSDDSETASEDDDLSDDADEGDAVEQTESEDDDASDAASDSAPEPRYAEDDDKFTYRFNGEEFELSVGEAKRLAGQERAIEHRMKDVVATERKVAELHQRAEHAGEEMYNRALSRYTPWQKFDWARALKDLPSDQYNSLRAEAQDAYNDVVYFGETLDRVTEERRQQESQARQTELQERSALVVKELSDPSNGIADFSETKLSDLGKYVLSQGIPEDRMMDVFHTPLLKMFEKARLYDLAQTVKTSPVVKTAKKITKQKTNVETTRGATNGHSAYSKAMKDLEAGGGRDAAVRAMMAGWQDD